MPKVAVVVGTVVFLVPLVTMVLNPLVDVKLGTRITIGSHPWTIVAGLYFTTALVFFLNRRLFSDGDRFP